MAKKIKSRRGYRFKKGQEVHLDIIYDIQSLCGGDWWDKKNDDDMEDWCIINRDITIEIIEH